MKISETLVKIVSHILKTDNPALIVFRGGQFGKHQKLEQSLKTFEFLVKLFFCKNDLF